MSSVVSIVLPVFGMVAIGYLAGLVKLFPEGTGRGLEHYLYRFALPILLFTSIYKADLPSTPAWSVWGAYFTGLFAAWSISQMTLRFYGA